MKNSVRVNTNPVKGESVTSLKVFVLLNIIVATPGLLGAQQQFSVQPASANLCAGGHLTLTASGPQADQTHWSFSSKAPSAGLDTTVGATTTLTASGAGVVTVTAAGSATQDVPVTVSDCPADLKDEVVRAILGFEQLGASGTPSDQNFVFDFFITRPVGNPHIRWWGNVKVASFPQQVNTQLVTFGQQFATTFGNLKVNQLAQSAEFVTGPEFVILPIPRRFELTVFLGGGANGPNNPTDNVTVFQVPDSTSPQYQSFTKQFGPVPTNGKYVAFLPESSERFLRQWQAGLRLYTFYNHAKNGLGGLPASVEFSIGQDEFVTNSHLSGLVGHVAAMHPFTFGDESKGKTVTIYLFGEATNAYKRATSVTPIPLAPALDSSSNPIPITDAGVYTVTVPANRRDTYRIGVGIDLVSVLTALWGTNK